MTRFIILTAFLSSIAHAQDVLPPPKPQDDGPSVADTMKFIETEMGSIGPVNYIEYGHDKVTGNDWTTKVSIQMTNVRATVAACRVDVHWRITVDEKVLYDGDAAFPLKAVEQVVVAPAEKATNGNPELSIRVEPAVFVLFIKRKGANDAFFDLYDESLANSIAKALVHVVELCG